MGEQPEGIVVGNRRILAARYFCAGG